MSTVACLLGRRPQFPSDMTLLGSRVDLDAVVEGKFPTCDEN
jgi:hypothetical protein